MLRAFEGTTSSYHLPSFCGRPLSCALSSFCETTVIRRTLWTTCKEAPLSRVHASKRLHLEYACCAQRFFLFLQTRLPYAYVQHKTRPFPFVHGILFLFHFSGEGRLEFPFGTNRRTPLRASAVSPESTVRALGGYVVGRVYRGGAVDAIGCLPREKRGRTTQPHLRPVRHTDVSDLARVDGVT